MILFTWLSLSAVALRIHGKRKMYNCGELRNILSLLGVDNNMNNNNYSL